VARNFNGTTDELHLSVGAGLAGMTHGTYAGIIRVEDTADFRTPVGFITSGGSFIVGPLQIDGSDRPTWDADPYGAAALPMGVWLPFVIRKPSGTVPARLSYYRLDTGAWTHANSGNHANHTALASTDLCAFATNTSGSESHQGDVALMAFWENHLPWAATASGDAAIEAAGLQWDLLAWLNSYGHRPGISFIANALGGTTTTTSFTITTPAAQAEGDLMCLEFTHRGTGDGSVSDNSGDGVSWTRKGEALFASSTFTTQHYYKRVTAAMAGGGDTITVTGLTDACAGILTVYRGVVASGDPFRDWTAEANASGNETHASVTTEAGDWAVLVVGNSPDLAVTPTAPLVERAERLSTGGTDASVEHASFEDTAGGGSGSLAWTQTNAASGSIGYSIIPASDGVAANPPSWLCLFDQQAVGQQVTDLTGGGGQQAAITGTTVVDGPPGFSYGADPIPSPGHGVAATPTAPPIPRRSFLKRGLALRPI
jgi:hypothetical protein